MKFLDYAPFPFTTPCVLVKHCLSMKRDPIHCKNKVLRQEFCLADAKRLSFRSQRTCRPWNIHWGKLETKKHTLASAAWQQPWQLPFSMVPQYWLVQLDSRNHLSYRNNKNNNKSVFNFAETRTYEVSRIRILHLSCACILGLKCRPPFL